MRVAVLGAFGYENTGDNLVGIATEQLLKQINPSLEIDLYSTRFIFSNKKIKNMGKIKFFNKNDSGFFDNLCSYDSIIIGGGGLLMPLDDFEMFLLLDNRHYPKIAWNALGSQYTPAFSSYLSTWYKKLNQAVDKVAYVSVRSQSTKRLLLQCCNCESSKIQLVPDAAIGLSFDMEEDNTSLLHDEFGLKKNKKLIGVSVGAELLKAPLDKFLKELAKALNNIKKGEDIDILIIPFGKIYGDALACEKLAQLIPNAIQISQDTEPEKIWRLIGLLEVNLTVRYHGVIAGIAQGIPTVILDCYLANEMLGSKLRDIAYQFNLDQFYMSPILSLCENPETRSFLELKDCVSLSSKIRSKIIYAKNNKSFWKTLSKSTRKEVRLHIKNMYDSIVT